MVNLNQPHGSLANMASFIFLRNVSFQLMITVTYWEAMFLICPQILILAHDPARWLADQLDVRLEADPDNVLNYLQSLSREETSI